MPTSASIPAATTLIPADRDDARPFPFAPYVFVHEEMTVERLRQDLVALRGCGFDAVRYGGGEGGCGARYLGEGRYDFAHTDLIFDLCDELGLRLIPNLRVGWQPWMAEAPHRVAKAAHLIEDEYHRLIEAYVAVAAARYRDRPCLLAWEGVGEPAGWSEGLEDDPRFIALFRAWLQRQYGDIAALGKAWGYNGPIVASVTDWDDWRRFKGMHFEKYRHRRDLIRFQTELMAERMQAIERSWRRHDGRHPVLTGAHQLLGNPTRQRWDFALQAAGADGFFSSIHNGWHNWILPDEFILPTYVQARLTRDVAKGKWALPYETTGGPNFRTAIHQYGMHPAEHWQMMMSFLGAGLQGVGLWSWNSRLSGPEAGEYALTDLQGQPSRRALLLGEFCRRCNDHRDELWTADAAPRAAILLSWDADCYAAMPGCGRLDGWSELENQRARLGAARALMQRNIPFAFVTDEELVAGQADRYPVVVVAGMALVRRDVMAALHRHAERGGRVVADAPFATVDEYSRVRVEGAGGEFERLCGAYARDHANGFHETVLFDGRRVHGQFTDYAPTTAAPIAHFADGRIAALRHALGAGDVRLFAFGLTEACFKPGNAAWEERLAAAVTDGAPPRATCVGAIAFHRRAAGVDHWFLINDNAEARTAVITATERYGRVTEVMAERDLGSDPEVRVDIPAGLGCWLRCEHER